MPYIEDSRRKAFTQAEGSMPTTAGELNFIITKACLLFLDKQVHSYETLNSIVGALECAKQEFYRRIVVPYEDEKIKQNGDVY